DRFDEAEAEQRRRLAFGGAVRAARKRAAGGIAYVECGGEGGAGRFFGLAGGPGAVRRRDLAAERGRLDAAREDGERSLRLGSQAQDVVAREDVERPAGRVVPDADLVDRAARSTEGGLEMAAPARAAVEDGSELRQALDLGEVELPLGELCESGGDAECDFHLDGLQPIAES